MEGKEPCSIPKRKADLTKARNNVHARFIEITKVFTPNSHTSTEPAIASWTPPPQSRIKIIVDAAFSSTKFALVAVARGHHRDAIFIWGKELLLCFPLQAEATAILWAMQLAIQERWSSVIIEGDAKLCLEPLSHPNLIPSWLINTTISNICTLAASFESIKFSRVCRTCNAAAH